MEDVLSVAEEEGCNLLHSHSGGLFYWELRARGNLVASRELLPDDTGLHHVMISG
jgi:hypothetical protein